MLPLDIGIELEWNIKELIIIFTVNHTLFKNENLSSEARKMGLKV